MVVTEGSPGKELTYQNTQDLIILLLFVNQVVWILSEGCLCFILNCCVTEKKILLVPMVYCLRSDSMAAPAQVVVK